MLECLANSVSAGEGGFATQHMDHAACLGVEMIGSARPDIVRSTAETGTIRPNILE